MFDVLGMPTTAIELMLSMYRFHEKINFSLSCAKAKRALRYITPQSSVMNLKVAIEYDGLNNVVEMEAVNGQSESVGRWSFYKRALDLKTEEIIGDTFVEIDLPHHHPRSRSPLTNVRTFHVLRSAAAFIDHFYFIYPNLKLDISFVGLTFLDLEKMPSIHHCITGARELKFQNCTIPEDEMLTLQELFQPHHRLVLKDSEFKFSKDFAVKSIKLRIYDIMEDPMDFISKNFSLFQCEELDFGGFFSDKEILKILRCWKSGKNPLLKLLVLNYDGEPDEVFSPLKAVEWKEPGPRMFKLGEFELDCTGGRDIRGPNKAVGTVNFTEALRDRVCPQLVFVVWD